MSKIGAIAAVIGGIMAGAAMNEQRSQENVPIVVQQDAKPVSIAVAPPKIKQGFQSLLPTAANQVRESIVSLKGPYAQGTGFFLTDENGKTYILSVHHILTADEKDENGQDVEKENLFVITEPDEHKGKKVLRIKFPSESDFTARDIDYATIVTKDGKPVISEKYDLALFEPLSKTRPGLKMRNFLKYPLKQGESVFSINNATGNPDSLSAGRIGYVSRKIANNDFSIIQVDKPTYGGESGSPLLTIREEDNGKILDEPIVECIGITVSVEPGADCIGYVVPIDLAELWLSKTNHIQVMGKEEQDTRKVLDVLRKFTVPTDGSFISQLIVSLPDQ